MVDLLSGAKNFLTKNPVGQVITKSLNVFSGIVQNPITALTKGAGAAEKQFLEDSPLKRTVKTLITTGTAAAATFGAGTVAGRALVGQAIKSAPSFAKSLIPKSFVGKAFVGSAALVGAPALTAQITKDPLGALRAVEQAPSKLIGFQENIYGFSMNPSLESAGKIFKDNPYLATGAAAALIAPLATGIPAGIGFVAGEVLGSKKDSGGLQTLPQPLNLPPESKKEQKALTPAEGVSTSPTTAETTKLSKVKDTTKKTRKRRRRKVISEPKQIINIKDSRGNDKYYF